MTSNNQQSMERNGPILIAEDNASGHRLNYVRMLITECSHKRMVVFVTTIEVANSAEFKLYLDPIKDEFYVRILSKVGLNEIRSLSIEINASAVIVPDADDHLYILLSRIRWSGSGELTLLVMRNQAQGRVIRSFIGTVLKRGIIALTRIKKNVNVLTLVPALSWDEKDQSTAPDPVEYNANQFSIDSMRHKLVGEEDRFLFGIVGAVSARKNVELVARALLKTGSIRLGLVIAGRIEPELRTRLEIIRKEFLYLNIPFICEDRLLSETEMDEIVGAVDCVVLAHSNEGPSGIMGKAAAAGTRILAAGARSLKRDCRHMQSSMWVALEESEICRGLIEVQELKAERMQVATPKAFAHRLVPSLFTGAA